MTDWTKYKVVDLKEECKSRDIALTGLKLKQQFIDKLQDYEAQHTVAPKQDDEEHDAEMLDEPPTPQATGGDSGANGSSQTRDANEIEGSSVETTQPGEPQTHEAVAYAATPPAPLEDVVDAEKQLEKEETPAIETLAQPQDAIMSGALPVSESETLVETSLEGVQTLPVDQDIPPVFAAEVQKPRVLSDETEQKAASPKRPTTPTPQSTQIPSDTSTPRTSQIPPSDLAEDQRNRRKRSATPDPSSEEVARKRARLSEDAPKMKVEGALEQTKVETGLATENRVEPTHVKLEEPNVRESHKSVAQNTTPTKPTSREKMPSRTRSRSPSQDRNVPPASHPATASLYISRLKRPIQPQAFRSHIISRAKSRYSDDSDPITSFYLDSIKTHAFVTFTSVSEASRVRSAMHGIRFPEEASREPLFVDFVPDDKVQSWIDQETGSGFGQVSGGRRTFEVVYEKGVNGVEAIFQETDPTMRRLPVAQSLGPRMSFDGRQPPTAPAGVHPDRATYVPRDNQNRDHIRPRAPPTGPKNLSPDVGKGFKALDELFKSTAAKPKLYYKPVFSSIAGERLDKFRDLPAGYAGMGRTGDEGMKRYSFGREQDREEWVDRGPEFGHGRRGQERLTGGDRGGRGRGRGGAYRGRLLDSYRGGSGR